MFIFVWKWKYVHIHVMVTTARTILATIVQINDLQGQWQRQPNPELHLLKATNTFGLIWSNTTQCEHGLVVHIKSSSILLLNVMVQRYNVGRKHECLATIQRRIYKLIPSLSYIRNEGLQNIRGIIIRYITRKYNMVRPADIRRGQIS